MKFLCIPFIVIKRPSPLAEGRELKYAVVFGKAGENVSPLAEGRELKYRVSPFSCIQSLSPLAEGRELKLEGIPLIIAPKPSTSSPLTKISRKSAVQAHCLHAK